MPDGDIVHSQLSGLYQKPYKWLCEGKANNSENAWVVKGAVIRDIQTNYGNVAVKYAKRMGEMLRQMMVENVGLHSSVNWAALSTEIDRQVGQAKVKHHVQELLRRAGKGILHEFRYKHTAETNNLPEAVVERFFLEVYKAKFEQRIPLTPNHHADVDNATVTERVEAIRSDMLADISKWAKKATANEDVKNLRRSPREKVKEIDLDEDLL
ncbi:hypothetical protein QUA70_26805 [Microcoleus sp. LAD1_D5]|jgi:hypothetical protein|uniref:hypothetical protein n=1 Tax=unclassified Microcoleus TaxID=2642155 RepID=UPI002FD33824